MTLPAMKSIAATPGTVSAMVIPVSSETIAPIDDLVLHVKTTGTPTTITFTDPGFTPSGSVAINPAVTMGATEERFIYVPAALANPSTGLIAVGFSSLTGVTGEWLRV